MGYIKKLKSNELVGGTDKHTIYPVTSTKAVFEEVTDGDKSSFKSQKTINGEHDDRIKGLEEEMPDTVKSITINGGTKTYLPENGNVELTIYSEGGEDYPGIAEAVQNNADNIEAIQNEIGTDTTEDTLSGRIKSLENAVGTGGSVDQRISNAIGNINTEHSDMDPTDHIQYQIVQSNGEITDLTIQGVDIASADALEALRQTYEGLTRTDIIIQDTAPTTGDEGVVYRVTGDTTYTDYMFYNGQRYTMATYDIGNLDPQVSYYTCATPAATPAKAATGTDASAYALTLGGHFKVEMDEANTATSGVTLQVGSATAKELMYNGAAVNAENTWEDGEVIAVYYYNNKYWASNAQGGGGKAEKIKYDNSESGLGSENVQEAVDEVVNSIGVVSDSVNITQLFDTSGWTNKKFIVGKQDSTHVLGDVSTSSSSYSFASGFVNISGYDLISITLPQLDEPLSTVGACFYDANQEPISGMYKGYMTPRDMVAYNYKVPEGAVYVRATKRTDSGFSSFSCHGIIGKSVKDLIDGLDSFVNPTKSIPFSLVNGFIEPGGNYVYDSGLKVTDNIDVSNIRHIYYSRSCYNSGAWLDVAFYDDGNNFIVGESVKNTSDSIYTPSVVLVPNGAVTARFTFKNSDRYGMRMILDADTDASLSNSIKFNKITSINFTDNKAADTVNGNVVDSTIHKCSDLIDIRDFRGGKLFYPRVYQTISYSSLGLCFYDSNQNFISGVPCAVNSNTIHYTETTIDVPSNAYFVRCSALMDVETYGDFYIELCAFASDRINILEEKSNWSEYNGVYSPKECNVRFYKAMEEKCLDYGIEGAIIEGPGGYGRADNTSDEVSNPVLGHGMAQLPVYGLVKIVSNCLNYPILKDIWNSSSHIIYTKGIEHELIVEPSIDGTYGHYLKDYYTVLTWKTGTNEDRNIRNLALTATSDDLKGVILSAFVHFSNTVENDTYNRYKAMKLLLDIGKKLFFDRNADISQEVSLLNAQTIGHAQVAVCPNYPAFMIDWDLNSSTYYKLWDYNGGTTGMNTFSVIKLLTAQVALDYVKDLDEYVDVLPYDIWIAPYSAPIFTAGEKVTYRDLLYAMLFPSSNQASYILSRNIGNLLLRTYRGDHFISNE